MIQYNDRVEQVK